MGIGRGSILNCARIPAISRGVTPFSPSSSCTPQSETLAFTTAAGIIDATQILALDNFVVSLKAINAVQSGFVDFAIPANSILKACYPFVGGDEVKHKFNLINPADSDAAFRLVFAGTVTHDEKGILPNGSTGYADTKLSARTVLNADSCGIDVYHQTQTYSASIMVSIGAGAAGADRLSLSPLYALQQTYRMWAKGTDTSTDEAVNGSLVGLHQINRTAAGIGNTKLLYNTKQIGVNAADAAGTLPAETLTIGKMNGLAYFCNRLISYVGIRGGITDAANTLYYAAIQKLQLDLNRSSLKNCVFEGHSMMYGSGATYKSGALPAKIAQSCNATYATRILSDVQAIGGNAIDDLIARYNINVRTQIRPAPYKNILPIWIGINTPDINADDASGASSWARFLPYMETAIADGWNVMVLTVTPVDPAHFIRSSIAIADWNALAAAYTNAKYTYVDLSGHAELMDPTNTTYFNDGLHLKDAGYAIVATDMIALINAL